ncbi:MAG: 2OG-Fe(II) oxygenase [Polyangiaceae bacterium]|nr:2OG-Fe(II) oxygenase [Polyangiaceae bacterium]
MPRLIEDTHYTIIDDFLEEDLWTKVWSAYQFTDLLPVTQTSGAWKLDDGIPLGGREIILPRHRKEGESSPETPVTEVDQPFLELLSAVLDAEEYGRRLVDDQWKKIAGRAYVYPRETGLSWHVDDSETYAGAFIYYAHPIWNAHWGGELMLAEPPEEPLPVMAYRFETETYSQELMDLGVGQFIAPKPNRLVLLGGAPHMIAQVKAAAGHNVRASVAGFFLR